MPTSFEYFNMLAENSHTPDFINTSQVVYDAIVISVEEALAATSEAERDERMRVLYTDLINETAKNALIHRGIMSWSMDMRETYQDRTIVSAKLTSQMVEEMLGKILNEKETDYVCKEKMGMSNEEYMDYIRSLATSITMKDVQNEFFKQATIESCENSISMLSEELLDKNKEIVFTGNMNNQNDRKIAEAYAVYDNAWKNIKEAGFFGNLFHPINFFKNVGIIRSANAIFKKTGFNTENDGPAVMEAFETTTDYCAERDLIDLEEMKGDIKDLNKQQNAKDNVTEISVARDKLRATANIAKGDPNNPIDKINAVFNKYGETLEEDIARKGMVGISRILEETVAREYDTMRQTSNFTDYIKGVFFASLSKIIEGAMKNSETLNVSEMVKDASDVAVIMADSYTVLYDAPELKEIAKNSAFGSYNSEMVCNFFERGLGEKGMGMINAANLKNEIEQAMSEYKNPIIENSRLEKEEENVNENTVTDVKEEETRINIFVDLDGNQPVNENKQPQIEEKPIVKEQKSI